MQLNTSIYLVSAVSLHVCAPPFRTCHLSRSFTVPAARGDDDTLMTITIPCPAPMTSPFVHAPVVSLSNDGRLHHLFLHLCHYWLLSSFIVALSLNRILLMRGLRNPDKFSSPGCLSRSAIARKVVGVVARPSASTRRLAPPSYLSFPPLPLSRMARMIAPPLLLKSPIQNPPQAQASDVSPPRRRNRHGRATEGNRRTEKAKPQGLPRRKACPRNQSMSLPF